jgi:hypothetical protein
MLLPQDLKHEIRKKKIFPGTGSTFFFGTDRFDRIVFTGLSVDNFFSSSNFDPVLFAHQTCTACYLSVGLFVFLCLSVLSVCLSVCMYRRYAHNV